MRGGQQELFLAFSSITNQSIIVGTLKTKPFVLSLSKHERISDAPFDKLRVNGDRPSEEHRD